MTGWNDGKPRNAWGISIGRVGNQAIVAVAQPVPNRAILGQRIAFERLDHAADIAEQSADARLAAGARRVAVLVILTRESGDVLQRCSCTQLLNGTSLVAKGTGISEV